MIDERYSSGWAGLRGMFPNDVPPATEEAMPEQLTRDQLLQQRLWAATNDCAAAMKELASLVDQPPTAGEDQEERMRGIETNISGMRWGCKKLREYRKNALMVEIDEKAGEGGVTGSKP